MRFLFKPAWLAFIVGVIGFAPDHSFTYATFVQAIRIQQSTGGRLADVLRTLAEFMRAREEVRREVKVLTAEGRVSAIVLSAMPPLLFLVFQIVNPGYADPLLHGWGLAVLGGAAASTAIGTGVIVRMVNIEV